MQTHGILTGRELEASVCVWLEDEVQKIGASRKANATRLPLSYALGVLEALVDKSAGDENDAQPKVADCTVRRVIPC